MSSANDAIARLLENNEKYSSTFTGAPTMNDLRSLAKSGQLNAKLVRT